MKSTITEIERFTRGAQQIWTAKERIGKLSWWAYEPRLRPVGHHQVYLNMFWWWEDKKRSRKNIQGNYGWKLFKLDEKH